VLVRGVEGLLRGEVLVIPEGREASVGRGSGSTLPLTRSAGYRAMSEDPVRLRQACQGVSRRHFRIAVPAPGEAIVEDLSRAGTFLDGSRIAEPVRLRDLRDRAHEIRFGRGEAVEIRWLDRPIPAGGPGWAPAAAHGKAR
jgi:pSer/pThr/pTyr-binding forkhead associated (FHA) protein